MRKLPRSLRFYVAASTLYAAVVFFAVQFIYTIQLTQSGILVAERDSGDVLSSIQIVSFIVWLGISLIAAAVMHRLATELAGAKSAEEEAKIAGEQKEQELGSIFGLAAATSFAALPLVSRERLVGALLLIGEGIDDLIADKVQLPMIMGQYVAGSIHSALSVKEAEARAEREALVNRIAQRARASLDPEEILRGTVDELAKVLDVSRALVCTGATEDDLAVTYEWDATGVAPVGIGAKHVPIARLAARLGRTVIVTDVRKDRRFTDPRAAEDVIQQDVIAAAATPIRVGGQLAGALSFSQVDRSREWTADDVRLIEAVAQELRVAITAAEAFERQRAAVAELERLNRAKSDFVSIVSHEFRTPLTGIQGFSEMMKSEDLTLDEMREYAGDINKDAHRLNRMITEMLDLDKMESGRMQLHRERLDLNAIVSDAVDHRRPNAPRHAVSVRLGPLVGEMHGDRDKLIQVMANLLSNAVKYSPKGGEIVVSSRAEGGAAHVVVRDHGMGIPKASLETIFERYGRVESPETRHIQGTGLALPSVRQTVHLHGGTGWAESSVGEGSVFHVTLPRAAAGMAAAEAAS